MLSDRITNTNIKQEMEIYNLENKPLNTKQLI